MSIAEVDCTVEKSVCESGLIKGYPTLKLFVGDIGEKYSGGRTFEELRDFVDEMVAQKPKDEEVAEVRSASG